MRHKRSKIWSLTDAEFTDVVLREQTSQKIIMALGLRVAGTAYTGLKERLQKLGLYKQVSANNFKLQAAVLMGIRAPLPDSEFFVKGRKISGAQLKVRLQRRGVNMHKCAMCGQDSTWNGKVLVLQVDHVNGDNMDNRLENLKMLCPNCHSQTETFSGRNVHQQPRPKHFCTRCKTEIAGKGKLGICYSCANKMRRKVINRSSLLRLRSEVSANGYSATGRKYGVSDVAVHKWLKTGRGNIPE